MNNIEIIIYGIRMQVRMNSSKKTAVYRYLYDVLTIPVTAILKY